MRTLFGGFAFLRMTPGSARTGGQFTRSTGQFKQNEKKMKLLIRSMNRSPLRCGFFTVAIALTWFALSPPLKAAPCSGECDFGTGSTSLGTNALPINTGLNNTAVGKSALESNTSGGFNRAVGGFAPSQKNNGQQKKGLWGGALAQKNHRELYNGHWFSRAVNETRKLEQ